MKFSKRFNKLSNFQTSFGKKIFTLLLTTPTNRGIAKIPIQLISRMVLTTNHMDNNILITNITTSINIRREYEPKMNTKNKKYNKTKK